MGKVLVTYASKYGATKGVAEAIAKTLENNGTSVKVLAMVDVKDVSGYNLIVAGSAIQGGTWLPEAIQFMEKYKNEFNKTKLATFLVCMTLAMPGSEKYREHVSTWLEPLRRYAKPVKEGIFTGALDTDKMQSFGDRMKFKISVAMGVWKEGDHRDWNAIQLWAESLQPFIN